MDDLKKLIREVPDFPKPGILFYDITTLLKDKDGLRRVNEALRRQVGGMEFDLVAGIESRGFIFGPVLADALGKGFVPVRKPGKLPAKTERVEYALEYGADAVEMHIDAVTSGTRVLVVDDLLATGGTAAAVVKLVEKLGGTVAGLVFVIELDFLKGREKLAGYPVRSLLHYDS
jgi:adenine phosphoribosyltransferase